MKPERYSLIPAGPLEHLARLYGSGAKKYENHQWRKGYEWSKSYDALIRHAQAFWSGQDLDVCPEDGSGCLWYKDSGDGSKLKTWVGPEGSCWNHTGAPHMAAVAWHAFALLEFFETHPDHDDRYIV